MEFRLSQVSLTLCREVVECKLASILRSDAWVRLSAADKIHVLDTFSLGNVSEIDVCCCVALFCPTLLGHVLARSCVLI